METLTALVRENAPSEMRIDSFLSTRDVSRVSRVLENLHTCGLVDYAVTGGLALEAALPCDLGHQRILNDIDIVVSGFDDLPPRLGTAFLVRHVHRRRPKGKLLVQLIDPVVAVRLDIFSACGATIARSQPAQFGSFAVKAVAIEDMACRIASKMMRFARGQPVPFKCAADYNRVVEVADPSLIEVSWREHRRSFDPDTFAETRAIVRNALRVRSGQFIEPVYSQDLDAVCARCEDRAPFRIAGAAVILAILGYC
jgi:hypothetical protein